MDNKVYANSLDNYNLVEARKSMKELLLDNNLLDFVKPNMTIAIKTNLVTGSKESQAIISSPTLLYVLCEILIEKEAKVIVGDSPGGLFNESVLKSIYNKSELNKIEQIGAKLNHDFSQEVINTENLIVVKHLDCSSWLLKADAIINFAKMKTHGMMSLSGATKNMFGSVPGTLKLEYHYRYPNHQTFANMLIDIQEFYKCKLHLVDGVLAMEGNGPTAGMPRKVGLILASNNPYNLDIVLAKIMNLNINNVPTITESIKRNLSCKSFEEINLNMDVSPYIVKDFKNIESHNSIEFYDDGSKHKLLGKIAKKVLLMRPKPNKKECIGCSKCAIICPAKAITMKNGKPSINKYKCIRCFCCQEFCPKGAMKTHRTIIGKIITKKKSSSK